MDDRTSGLVIRALRRRRGWRQVDLAEWARVSQSTISRAERGWLEHLTLRVIRAIFAVLEARVQLAPRWKGAELERLLDEDDSAAVAAVARRLEALGWSVYVEVTYSEFGRMFPVNAAAIRGWLQRPSGGWRASGASRISTRRLHVKRRGPLQLGSAVG